MYGRPARAWPATSHDAKLRSDLTRESGQSAHGVYSPWSRSQDGCKERAARIPTTPPSLRCARPRWAVIKTPGGICSQQRLLSRATGGVRISLRVPPDAVRATNGGCLHKQRGVVCDPRAGRHTPCVNAIRPLAGFETRFVDLAGAPARQQDTCAFKETPRGFVVELRRLPFWCARQLLEPPMRHRRRLLM